MDNFAVLEIIASINKLTSQIADMPKPNSSGFWQPWMGTIVGVIIGFSLNYLKDSISQSSNIRKKINSIKFEVEDIKDNSAYGMKCMLEYYDMHYKNPGKHVDLQVPAEVVTLCFDKYYHEVILKINKEQRDSLVKTYVHALYAEEQKRNLLIEMRGGGLSLAKKNYLVDSMVSAYAVTYHSAKLFLEDLPRSTFRQIDLFNELGLESDYISKVNDLERGKASGE